MHNAPKYHLRCEDLLIFVSYMQVKGDEDIGVKVRVRVQKSKVSSSCLCLMYRHHLLLLTPLSYL